MDGSWIALATLFVGLIGGQTAQAFARPDSPWPNAIRVLGVAGAIFFAAYREWDRWATHNPPSLVINPYFYPGGGLSIQVTNDDADGRFRGSVTDLTGPDDSTLSLPGEEPFPWALAWGDQKTLEIHLIRDENTQARIVAVDVAANEWQVAGPDGSHRLELTSQPAVVVHVRIVRIEPASGLVEKSWLVRYGPTPPDIEVHPGPAQAVARAFDATVTITDALQAQISRGPNNPGTDEVNWRTEGKRDQHIHLDRKPLSLRFFEPVDQIVTTLPASIAVGKGRVIVTRFFDQGFMVDEVGTIGDVVRAQPYFADVSGGGAP